MTHEERVGELISYVACTCWHFRMMRAYILPLEDGVRVAGLTAEGARAIASKVLGQSVVTVRDGSSVTVLLKAEPTDSKRLHNV